MIIDAEHEKTQPQRDCAWCGLWFSSILELLDHVDSAHLIDPHVSDFDLAA